MTTTRTTASYLGTAICLLLFIHSAESKKNGAPESVCTSMAPGHYPPTPSSDPFVYQIEVPKTTYFPGEEIEMKLNGGTFKGFLVEVRNSGGTPVGSFVAGAAYTGKTVCSGKGWTHTNGDQANTEIKLKWKAPATSAGTVDVTITVVESYTNFWIKRQVKQLTVDPTFTGTATSTQPTTQPPPKGTIAYSTDCGSTIGCYHDCSSGSCTFMVTWMQGTDTTDFTLSAKVSSPNRWIALAFSSDNSMGTDSVTECTYENNQGSVGQSYNPGKSNTKIQQAIGLSKTEVTYADGVLSCKFTRQNTVSGNSQVFDITKNWYLLFGQGPFSGGSKSRHESDPIASSALVDFAKTEDTSGQKESHLLYKLHGSFMIFSWICAASIGIVCATWYKLVWPETKIAGLAIWFQIHRLCMILTFLVTIAGFVIIFVKEQEYSIITDGGNIKQYHPVFGIITTALCIFNPFMALCRPKPDAEKRWIFNFFHWLVGVGAHCMGIVAMFGGVQMDDVELPTYTTYILYGFVGWYLFIVITLELLTRCCAMKKAGAAYEMTEIGKATSQIHERRTSAAHGVMKVIFVFHVLIVIGFATAIIVLMFKKP